MLAAALCLGNAAVKWANSPRHVEQLASQFCSVASIQFTPAVNAAADRIAVIQSTESGVGVFVVDVRAGTTRKLREVTDGEYYEKARAARIWGWSPDDSVLAFTWADEPNRYRLLLYDGAGHEQLAALEAPDGIRALTWLNSNLCVYVDWQTNLVRVEAGPNGWAQTKVCALPSGPGRVWLDTVNPTTAAFAWLPGKEVWCVNVRDGSVWRLYSAPGRFDIEAARYSMSRQALLVAETVRRSGTSVVAIVSFTPSGMTRWDACIKPTVRDVAWLNNSRGFAYLVREGGLTYVGIRPDVHTPEVRHFHNGVASIFSNPGASALYVVGSLSNEPPRVWACSGDCLDPAPAYTPWDEAQGLPPSQPVFTGWAKRSGHSYRFEVVPPANFSPRRKYPLVIGLGSYTWSPVPHAAYCQVLARCGAYVALTQFTFGDDVHRRAMEHVDVVNAVYEHMIASPNVDRDRVYIFAFSGSTAAIAELVRRYPGRFRGVVLLHPSELPEPTADLCRRVVLTAGEDESWLRRRIPIYRENLMKLGIPSEACLHGYGGHIARAQGTMRERAILMARLVFKE